MLHKRETAIFPVYSLFPTSSLQYLLLHTPQLTIPEFFACALSEKPPEPRCERGELGRHFVAAAPVGVVGGWLGKSSSSFSLAKCQTVALGRAVPCT